VLHSNAIEVVQVLIHGCAELGIPIPDENKALCDKIEVLSSIETVVDPALAADLKVGHAALHTYTRRRAAQSKRHTLKCGCAASARPEPDGLFIDGLEPARHSR
jgi:hypothetical protein